MSYTNPVLNVVWKQKNVDPRFNDKFVVTVGKQGKEIKQEDEET